MTYKNNKNYSHQDFCDALLEQAKHFYLQCIGVIEEFSKNPLKEYPGYILNEILDNHPSSWRLRSAKDRANLLRQSIKEELKIQKEIKQKKKHKRPEYT